MKISIDVPDWMIRDYEAKTSRKLDAGFVRVAVNAYYMRLYDPLYNPHLSEAAKVALYGVE